jgi:endonuclease YncB( thermonuclease family)
MARTIHKFRRRPRLPSDIRLAPYWRRRPVFCAALVALALLVLLGRSAPPPNDDFARYHDQVLTVTHVVDGDTFDVGAADGARATTRVRLWGVDTPETAHSPKGAMHYGEEAKVFARDKLEGHAVRLLLLERRTRDRYGRLLAYASLEETGESFNDLLIKNGLAYADWRFPHPHKTHYRSLERKARRDRVGLWADVRPEDMPHWRRRFEE